jgi:hypothetical protein
MLVRRDGPARRLARRSPRESARSLAHDICRRHRLGPRAPIVTLNTSSEHMSKRHSQSPWIRTLSTAGVSSLLSRAAAAGLLGLGARPKRRDNSGPLLWVTAGLAVGAAAALLIAPSTGRDLRARLLEPLQKTGGGIGKRIGQLVGSQVGAHPVATTKLVQGARDVFGTAEK